MVSRAGATADVVTPNGRQVLGAEPPILRPEVVAHLENCIRQLIRDEAFNWVKKAFSLPASFNRESFLEQIEAYLEIIGNATASDELRDCIEKYATLVQKLRTKIESEFDTNNPATNAVNFTELAEDARQFARIFVDTLFIKPYEIVTTNYDHEWDGLVSELKYIPDGFYTRRQRERFLREWADIYALDTSNYFSLSSRLRFRLKTDLLRHLNDVTSSLEKVCTADIGLFRELVYSFCIKTGISPPAHDSEFVGSRVLMLYAKQEESCETALRRRRDRLAFQHRNVFAPSSGHRRGGNHGARCNASRAEFRTTGSVSGSSHHFPSRTARTVSYLQNKCSRKLVA